MACDGTTCSRESASTPAGAGEKARYQGLDLLRAWAAFVVVLIHTPGSPSDKLQPLLLDLLPPANAVFAIMAGYHMIEGLRKAQRTSAWLSSRVRRLLVPFFVWSLVYVLMNVAFDVLQGKPANFLLADGRQWLEVFFCGGGATHLWFLPTLFYAQCLVFLAWQLGRRHLSVNALALLAALLGFLTACCYPHVQHDYLRKLVFMVGYVSLGGVLIVCEPVLSRTPGREAWTAVLVIVANDATRLLLGRGLTLPWLVPVFALAWVLLGRAYVPRRPSQVLLSMG